jgi:hypothetical protein
MRRRLEPVLVGRGYPADRLDLRSMDLPAPCPVRPARLEAGPAHVSPETASR